MKVLMKLLMKILMKLLMKLLMNLLMKIQGRACASISKSIFPAAAFHSTPKM